MNKNLKKKKLFETDWIQYNQSNEIIKWILIPNLPSDFDADHFVMHYKVSKVKRKKKKKMKTFTKTSYPIRIFRLMLPKFDSSISVTIFFSRNIVFTYIVISIEKQCRRTRVLCHSDIWHDFFCNIHLDFRWNFMYFLFNLCLCISMLAFFFVVFVSVQS